jgi:TPR repeat protein
MKKILLALAVLLGLNNNLYADDFEDTLKACERGSAYNCMILGMKHEWGEDTKKDKTKAFYYYKKSCDEGSATGCRYMAKFYEKGIGTEKNLKEAIRIYKFLCDEASAGWAKGGCRKYKELTE